MFIKHENSASTKFEFEMAQAVSANPITETRQTHSVTQSQSRRKNEG